MFIRLKLPLHHIEDPFLRNTYSVSNPKLKIMSRPALQKQIDEIFNNNRNELKIHLQSAAHIFITADLWSSYRKSFIGVTGHWIDQQNLKRCSDVFALRRMKGSHTGDSIAAEVRKVLDELNIGDKTDYCMTDGASNMNQIDFRITVQDRL